MTRTQTRITESIRSGNRDDYTLDEKTLALRGKLGSTYLLRLIAGLRAASAGCRRTRIIILVPAFASSLRQAPRQSASGSGGELAWKRARPRFYGGTLLQLPSEEGCPGTFSQSMVRGGMKLLCVCASLRIFGEELQRKEEGRNQKVTF